MDYKVTLPLNIKNNESIVLPISMHQPLERGSRLQSLLHAIIQNGYQAQTTVLVCDYLNRHNCTSEQEAYVQGDLFLAEHQHMLDGFEVLRWADFINSRKQKFQKKLSDIQANSREGSIFYKKMMKTWEKCLSANYSKEASLVYQQEEYAAILCMDEYDHLIYPKRITNGMACLYNDFSGKKPVYHHVKISNKPLNNKSSENSKDVSEKKERRHLHIAFRTLIDHTQTLLNSDELSDKSKKMFSEEMENLLMMHGISSQKDNKCSETATSSGEVS